MCFLSYFLFQPKAICHVPSQTNGGDIKSKGSHNKKKLLHPNPEIKKLRNVQYINRPTTLFMNSPNCFVCIEQLDDPYQMQIVIPKKDTRGLQQRTADDDRTISFQRPVSQGESSPCFKKSIKKKKNKKHNCQLMPANHRLRILYPERAFF